jgi:S-adenosylhomocysteine hydrolase
MATAVNLPHDVKDMALADAGRLRIEWADQFMPTLRTIRQRFAKEQPLKGVRIIDAGNMVAAPTAMLRPATSVRIIAVGAVASLSPRAIRRASRG